MFLRKLSAVRFAGFKLALLGLLLGAVDCHIPRAVAQEFVHSLTVHNRTPYPYYVQWDVAPDSQSRFAGWQPVPAGQSRTWKVSCYAGVTIKVRGYEIGHLPPDYAWERDVVPNGTNGDYDLDL